MKKVRNEKGLYYLMLLLLGVAGQVVAAPVMVYDGGLGTWSDVNKTSVVGAPDSLMCWAAAASNVLDWTEWWGWDGGTNSYIDDTADIYAAFDSGWGNKIGAPTYAYEWWMTDRIESILESSPGVSAFPFDSPGLNFYPGVNVQEGAGSVTAFVKEDGADTIHTWVGNYITDDRGIVASIDVPNGPGGVGPYAHSVTIWGWDPVAGEIYLTDSDDGMAALRTFDFHQAGGEMFIDDYTNLYTAATDVLITQLTRLNRNSPFIEPRHPGGPGPGPDIPEPATMLLLGSGLLGLAFGRRRFRKS